MSKKLYLVILLFFIKGIAFSQLKTWINYLTVDSSTEIQLVHVNKDDVYIGDDFKGLIYISKNQGASWDTSFVLDANKTFQRLDIFEDENGSLIFKDGNSVKKISFNPIKIEKVIKNLPNNIFDYKIFEDGSYLFSVENNIYHYDSEGNEIKVLYYEGFGTRFLHDTSDITYAMALSGQSSFFYKIGKDLKIIETNFLINASSPRIINLKGRIMIGHVYSDDFGKSWKKFNHIPYGDYFSINDSIIVLKSDNTFFISHDQGTTFATSPINTLHLLTATNHKGDLFYSKLEPGSCPEYVTIQVSKNNTFKKTFNLGKGKPKGVYLQEIKNDFLIYKDCESSYKYANKKIIFDFENLDENYIHKIKFINNRILSVGASIYYSDDFAKTWKKVSNIPAPDFYKHVFDVQLNTGILKTIDSICFTSEGLKWRCDPIPNQLIPTINTYYGRIFNDGSMLYYDFSQKLNFYNHLEKKIYESINQFGENILSILKQSTTHCSTTT